MLEIFRTRRR